MESGPICPECGERTEGGSQEAIEWDVSTFTSCKELLFWCAGERLIWLPSLQDHSGFLMENGLQGGQDGSRGILGDDFSDPGERWWWSRGWLQWIEWGCMWNLRRTGDAGWARWCWVAVGKLINYSFKVFWFEQQVVVGAAHWDGNYAKETIWGRYRAEESFWLTEDFMWSGPMDILETEFGVQMWGQD